MRYLIFLAAFLYSNSLVIYNDFGFVKEDRDISLREGINRVKYKEFPNSLVVDSIFIESDSNFTLLSTSFFPAKDFQKEILSQNLNRVVSFYDKDKKLLKGVLRRIEPIVIEVNGKFYIVSSIDSIIFSLYKPKLASIELMVESKEELNSTFTIDYLVDLIEWESRYVLNIEDNKSLALKNWALVKNSTNRDFKGFNIRLVAAEVNRVGQQRVMVKRGVLRQESFSNQKSSSIHNYYYYDIGKRELLKNQTTLFLLNSAKGVRYRSYGVAKSRFIDFKGERELRFDEIIEFNNSKSNGLGEPLSKGVIRVYRDGFYLGEDRVLNTPRGEIVKVRVGEIFDVIGKSRVVEFINRAKYKFIKQEYEIKNKKESPIEVRIVEEIPK
ncbi:MAG: DUF4139 domain-containing protein, partial [Epsilonproteobacteria bacterium]|nr:DUF4139 domain-containing protein [Campylobacterota bacterium]